MMLQNYGKISLLLLIFLNILNQGSYAHLIPSENSSVTLHNEVTIQVGVVLDMESWVAKSIRSFITMAISDFYTLNNGYRTRVVLHTRDSKNDPLQALSAVLDLLNNIKVQAIIGPETYLEAKLLASIADKAKVPMFSFAGSPSLDYPYSFLLKEDKSIMAKSIAAVVESFKRKDVIFIYEDTDHGPDILPYLVESFQDKNIEISHRSAITTLATNEQITDELHKLMTNHTTVIVLHMSSSLASRLILIAKRLGMVSKEYAWIITKKTVDLLQAMDFEVIESLKGVIGLRPYIPASSKLLNLMARWYNECYIKYPTLVSREVAVLAVWAYDMIWALAESVERLVGHFSLHTENNTVVPQIGSMLSNEVLNLRFKGISGEFQLIDGKLVSNGFESVNLIGYGEGTRMHLYSGTGVEAVIWPGGSKTVRKGRMLQVTHGKKLKVGVLTRRKFKYFIDADYDIQKNVTTATGFSVDVFSTCIRALTYEVPYELVPFANGSYDDLIKKVYIQEIDAILGDSSVLANRSLYVDFTATYSDLGIGTLAKIKDNDMWIFLKPLDVDLWLTTAAFAVLTSFVVWAIESMDQGSQSSPSQRIGTAFWFILMTLFFVQREKLSSNLSKLVVFVWLFVILILVSSYTATLTSLLTVEQFELASKGGAMGFHGGSFEAGLAGVTISNLHFEDYRQRPYYSYEDYADALSRGGKHGGADAIIDEIPYIKMFLGKYPNDYAMISSEPTTSGFAFVFQKGSPLVAEVSRQIAKIREDGTLRLLEKKWFENQFMVSSQDPPTKPKTLNVGRFQGLFLISGISSCLALLTSLICLLRAKMEIHSIIYFIARRNIMATLRRFIAAFA